MRYFILDKDGKPKQATSEEWSQWFVFSDAKDRQVALTECGDISVSTVFIGIPAPYETLMSGRREQIWRYDSLDEAKKGHAEAVALAESLALKRLRPFKPIPTKAKKAKAKAK